MTEVTEALGVSRKSLSSIGHAGISPEMAIRLSMAFETSAESWLNQQSMFRSLASGATALIIFIV
ncbi:helix-turn-helix transcriptional regulator [Candidatus Competibacter phosphatis]|uniref:helix-turn-helix transcriptional regulator n=1 Tax=Candidatus Competibacter phosphatis TaxID=221280 RepID=UPI003B967E2A